jgi:NAD-dependent SIR2 family protein deacetylase
VATTCRDVAIVLGLEEGPAHRAAHIVRHLSACPKCVAFERQLAMVDEAVKTACACYGEELPSNFEERLTQRLCS